MSEQPVESGLVNGHNVLRIGILVESLLNPPPHGVALLAASAASDAEKAIANFVAERAQKMLKKGYMPGQIAAFAKDLAKRCAQSIEPGVVPTEVAGSSEVEPVAVNHPVGGSNPPPPANDGAP